MQKTAYYCDNCKKLIGEKLHITLMVNKGTSGIAIPPQLQLPSEMIVYKGENWIVKGMSVGFAHFCNGDCIGKYFQRLMVDNGYVVKPSKAPRKTKVTFA